MSREKIKRLPELDAEQARRYRREVADLAGRGSAGEADRRLCRAYAPDKPLGRAICESYSLEELAAVLADRARELGRAPTQEEVFPLYRAYLKRRFGTWPAALRAAGLRHGTEVSAAAWEWPPLLAEQPGTARALLALAERRRSAGVPPRRQECPESGPLRAAFGDWNRVLTAAADLDRWLEEHPFPLAPPDDQKLSALRELADRLGRTPLWEETPEELRLALRLGWGSWSAALAAANLPSLEGMGLERARWELEQRRRAGDCPLRLEPNPSPEQLALLDRLEALCRRLGRAPLREELPQELRNRLADAFGSLRNALFQLGRAPLSGPEAQKLRLKQRRLEKLW